MGNTDTSITNSDELRYLGRVLDDVKTAVHRIEITTAQTKTALEKDMKRNQESVDELRADHNALEKRVANIETLVPAIAKSLNELLPALIDALQRVGK